MTVRYGAVMTRALTLPGTGALTDALYLPPEFPPLDLDRCGHCGTRAKPATTVVIDWRAELLCDDCVAIVDLSAFTFDPVTNAYSRT